MGKKCSSLPKFYHGIDSKRGIPVSTLRAFEKQGHKLVKLRLDIKYFGTCLDWRRRILRNLQIMQFYIK